MKTLKQGVCGPMPHYAVVFVSVGLAIMCAACGGGGEAVDSLSPASSAIAPEDSGGRHTALLISEDEIALLPAWQQELLCDPGWNQPYLEPPARTEIEPPTPELLMEDYQRVMTEGVRYGPRTFNTAKGSSWLDIFPGPDAVLKGEYWTGPRDFDPPFGCNTDGTNGPESNEHAFEDVIRQGNQHLPHVLDYVMQGVSTPNWFNTTGGAGNDAQSAVYQLFASAGYGDPHDWPDPGNTIEFEELTYRADLAPGVPPGGDCSAAEAFLVEGLFWKRFNSVIGPLPDAPETELYNILIAPQSEASAVLASGDPYGSHVDGRYQEFYFGTVGECYGGAWIVGLELADSGCEVFDDSVNGAYAAEDPYHYLPVYGVLLKRWQQMRLAGMAGPWESRLGWPAWGPVAYKYGEQQLTPRGTYYAWGMWFERGFIWWIDYDQEAYPNTPDEAQTYVWTGNNVFCANQTGATYRELAPAVYYGGGGELGVSVVVDSYRYEPAEPWLPVLLDPAGKYYKIALPTDEGNPSGTGTLQVSMHAHPHGGAPNENCGYEWYVWAFRDGTIAMGNEADAQYVNHTFGNTIRNVEQTCVVRVQVTDSEGNIGYGDSLPIILASELGGSGTR